MEKTTLTDVDLSGRWEFQPEGGPWTSVQVPGGGWLKQGFDCEAGAYQRRITIPDTGQPQVVRLELGAVNHIAEYFLGEDERSLRPIGSQVTAFTAQEMDLTPFVQPGGSYLLRIAVRAFQNGRPVAPHWAEWCECIARGIFRSARLRVYPQIYLADGFVKTSVLTETLVFDAWVTNASGQDETVTLGGKLAGWDGRDWPYPEIPPLTFQVPAGTTRKINVGPLPWLAGAESYWRPNVPYRVGYRANLHLLDLSIQAGEGARPVCWHAASVRFGFRELRQERPYFTLNGTRINFRGDNLQAANYDRVDHGGQGDAIDTLPGFLPPSETNPGWPKAVDNFLRLNYNVQRQHMGPWTPYMLDVCDELGLMLIGESATRWDGFDMDNGRGFHEVKCLEDIIRRDRNHPCIVRWSAKNEAQCLDPAYHLELYQAIQALDDTRPISEDIVWLNRQVFDPQKVFAALLDKPDFTWIDHYITYGEDGQPYFSTIQHNDAVIPMADRPYGLGEADWFRCSTPAGLVWFATTTALARAQGASDVRPYVLLSSWTSSVPGVKTTDLLTEENRHPVYGEDNLPDPWSHSGIRLLQQACHPLLALDANFWHLNRVGDPWGHFPAQALPLPAGQTVSREITVFNDDLAGDSLELVWDVREGSLSNRPLAQGCLALRIPPGEQRRTFIAWKMPVFNTFVFLTLRVRKDGTERFCDDLTCYEITGGEDFRPEFNGETRKFL